MKIAIGSDHGGFDRKDFLLKSLGEDYDIVDVGVIDKEKCDYPVYAERVARMVSDGRADFGILVCTTGIGMSIAANKIKGIRAALVCDPERARLTRQHNDANVLCLAGSSQFMADSDAFKIANIFLETDFIGNNPGEERHVRRVGQIKTLDEGSTIQKGEEWQI
ncbi:ribose 5-phosphate isomerase B [bacterium]|nr:MAG: ribose 5-phosphate isomerase B [bacterium]